MKIKLSALIIMSLGITLIYYLSGSTEQKKMVLATKQPTDERPTIKQTVHTVKKIEDVHSSNIKKSTLNEHAQQAITEPNYLPPLNKSKLSSVQYKGDLDDHKAYEQFQQEKQRALESSFVSAVNSKVATLENLLAKGRKQGMKQEQLQEAIDKIALLKKTQKHLINLNSGQEIY